MLRYLIFITIGILLYLLLNIYNTFSIGGIIRIPLGTSLVVDQINFMDSENVPHTPRITANTFRPIDHIYLENGQYYYYTDINMQDIYDANGNYDENLIETINNNIIQATEQERIARQERERRARIARQERERRARIQFLNMMQKSDDNLFKDGDIVIFTDNTGYRDLQITTFNLTGDARGGMTDDPILLPSDLPGYRPPGANRNSPRMYFVVRPITLVNFWRTRTTTYTIVGFGGQNTHDTLSGGAYIQELINLDRFVPISNINLVLDGFEERQIRRRYINLLDTLQDEFNRIHNPDDRRETRLDVTDYIRWHVYREGEPCAAIAEGIPPP